MALVFHYGSGSPFAWRVWLALEHKGLAYEARRVRFDQDGIRGPAFLALNPRGRVPAIEHDGFALRESAVILEYLEDRFPTPALLPGDARARARARLIAREADEHLYPPLRRLLSQVLFPPAAGAGGDLAEVAAGREATAAECARLEGEVGAGAFLVGGEPTLADFTLYPHLRLLRRVGERAPEHGADDLIGPRLAAWMARVEALPYFDRTLPPHWRE